MPAQNRLGKIITFYSYKGGTGRSMALANMAWVLASNGKRVLVVDWDLEAPGLHRFIHPFLEDKSLSDSTGVIDFVVDFSAEAMTPPENPEEPLPDDWYTPYANILRHAVPLNWKSFRKPGALHFIPAGKQDASYAKRVNAFNWQKFYDMFGGFRFLEAAKKKMKAEYDYVLIDSRTGVSDTSGICTVQMPDVLVVCFTLNSQSIEGARAVAESVDAQRRTASGASGLRIYPVPMRVETGEKEKLELARVEAWSKFSPFLWHIAEDELSRYWGRVETLYQPFYAYEEVLATFGDKPNQTNSLLASIERLIGYVTGGEVTQLVPPDEQERRAVLLQYARRKQTPEPVGDESAADKFWFYLSYAVTDLDENVEQFYKDLSAEVRRLQGLGDGVIGCLPRRPPSPGVDDLDRAERALLNSRVLVPLYSPAYFASEQCARELNFFSLLSGEQSDESAPPREGAAQILPVSWIPSDPLPPGVERYGHSFKVESPEYPNEGLFYLMRLQRHEDDYQAFVRRFARALVKLAEARAPRPILPRTSLRDAPTLFADSGLGTVFISHGTQDRESAQAIANRLSGQEGVQVLDRESMPRGRSPIEALDDAIRKASRVLILIGTDGMGPWQRREVSLALQQQGEEGGRAPRIIPVLLPGVAPEAIQGFLSLYTWIDLRKGLDDAGALAEISRAVRGEQPSAPSQSLNLTCPYPGLRPFGEEDARLFFGREALLQHLYQKLKSLNLAAIIGPVSSGKSSLVKAGLLPLLRRQKPPEPLWEALVITPGQDPFLSVALGLLTMRRDGTSESSILSEAQTLRQSLAQGELTIDFVGRAVLKELSADRLLVVVDQFEEIFTLTMAEEQRHAFASMIFGVPDDSVVTVLLASRSDFYDLLLALDPAVAGRLEQGLVNLGQMSQDELSRAIENPVLLVNLRFQPGLVERILDDFKDQSGGLPLLQATLVGLCERREGDILTHKAYQHIGGIRGAVAEIAEAQLARLSASEREDTLRVLARMVSIPTSGRRGILTRQAIKLGELSAAELEVVSRLANARLVTIVRSAKGEIWAELAYDALLLNWERLKAFIDNDREFLLWRQALRARVNDWEQAGRSFAFPLTESDARKAEFYLEQRGTNLSENERAYIRWSSEQTRKLSRRRRLRTLGTMAATAVIAAVTVAYWQFKVRPTTSQVLLAGRVLDANSQQPISKARVTVETEGSPQVIYTDSNGVFLVKLPGSAESVRAKVDAESYQSFAMMVPVSGPDITDIRLSPVAARPSIQITKLPAFGGGGPNSLTLIEGRITNNDPGNFRVVVYAYTNRWYVQPETASPLVGTNPDGTWAAKIHQGTRYAVLLVPPTFKPVNVTNDSPEKLSNEIIDSRILEDTQ